MREKYATEIKEVQSIYECEEAVALELLVQYQGNVKFVVQRLASEE